MKYAKMLILNLILSIMLILSIGTMAHSIAITPAPGFPNVVTTSSTTMGTFTVTNRTRQVPLQINVNVLPSGSGLSIASTTCNRVIGHGQSCVITVSLQAPANPHIIHADPGVIAWAYPTPDAVHFPFTINVIAPIRYTITPSAGPGGSISPSTPQQVNSGASLSFTASPASGFSVYQWLLDNLVVQTGGTTYTLNNITSNNSIEVTFANPVLTAVGQNLTNSQPPLLAISTDGINWSVPTIADLPANGIFNATSCTGSGATAVCTAAGVELPSTYLLEVSTNGGTTWLRHLFVGALGQFNTTSCTGSGATAICVAAGVNSGLPNPSLLEVSTDGGVSWAMPLSFTNADYRGASCSGTGSAAVCAVAGKNNLNRPLLAVGTNGGNSWIQKSISGLVSTGIFNTTSCTGSGSTAICIAAGQITSTSQPLLAQSTDGGNTWALVAITNLPNTDTGIFNSSSCTGTGAATICTAVGQDTTTSAPLLAESTDGGSTWAIVPITGLPNTDAGVFKAASCSGTSTTAICTAAGQDFTTNAPILAESPNGGITWVVQSIPGLTGNGVFNAASCTGSSVAALCTAAGQDLTNNPGAPLLVVSTNGGVSWSVRPITNAPVNGIFYGTSASSSNLMKIN